jgi:integrase
MGELIFAGRDRGKSLSHPAMLYVLQRLGSDVTTHGMRAAFRTWAQERTGFQREVVEMCLAHAIGDATERAYARGDLLDKRRAVMQGLGGFFWRGRSAPR